MITLSRLIELIVDNDALAEHTTRPLDLMKEKFLIVHCKYPPFIYFITQLVRYK